MASVEATDTVIVVSSNNKVIVYENETGECTELICEKRQNLINVNQKSQDGDSGTLNCTDRILAIKTSESGSCVAACDDHKQLWLWKNEFGSWNNIFVKPVIRRGTSITFSQDESFILLADKSGDIYRFATDGGDSGELMMGHLSMVLDVMLTVDDKYLITCDRDEKIRVSNYPNTHNINSFCLGHTAFVSQILYIKEGDMLVSGSGDGTLRFWNYQSGKELYQKDCSEHLEEDSNNVDIKCLTYCEKFKNIAVSFDNSYAILLFNLNHTSKELELKQKLKLECNIWSMSFDTKGNVFVLTADSSKHARCFVRSENNSYHEENVSKVKILDIMNSKPDFFKGADSIESIFQVLHKAPCEANVAEYMDRKYQRIENQKQKRKEKDKRRKRKGKNENNESDEDEHSEKRCKENE